MSKNEPLPFHFESAERYGLPGLIAIPNEETKQEKLEGLYIEFYHPKLKPE